MLEVRTVAGRTIAVIGGVNMDIGGRSFSPLVMKDSNPGRVTMSLGCVGRNIAHNLSLLGRKVCLLTALGDDPAAMRIRASCMELGIDIGHALTVPGGRTSTYLYLDDSDGDMALALSDMSICDRITPAYLAENEETLSGAALAVADTNIPEESLAYLTEHCPAPVFADPVSAAKAGKLRPVLGRIHTLKANRLEAEILSGIRITGEESLRAAAEQLLRAGLQRIFITVGTGGFLAADREQTIRMPCLPAEMRNATGAGDAFLAALAWAWTEKCSLETTCRAAAAAAAMAVESEKTINETLSPETLRRRMQS